MVADPCAEENREILFSRFSLKSGQYSLCNPLKGVVSDIQIIVCI